MKIIPASPYTDISRLKRAAGTVAPTPPRGLPGSGRPAAYQRQAAPENKRWNIIVREAKKRGIRTLTDMKKWAEQELKSGGFLAEYFRREKALGPVRQRAVAQRYAERQRKLKSEMELQAIVPAREFFRWRKEDKHFWEDKSNLKSLKRDNPDLLIYT